MQDVTKVVLNHDVQTKPLCRAPVCNAARMDRRNHCKQRKMPLSSHQKFITLKNFNEGIKFWRETYWPRDFHNQFYAELAKINKAGRFSVEWWHRILPHLKCWGVIRSNKPLSAKDLTRRAKARLKRLNSTYQRIANAPNDIKANGLTWETVKKFTKVVTKIKNATTPTFCSKFCHFVSPKRFPVTDSGATGLPKPNYEKYWNYVRKEWRATSKKLQENLKRRLQLAAGVALRRDFPYACKIAEICLIGRHQRRLASRS
jgi:hypothetical protein